MVKLGLALVAINVVWLVWGNWSPRSWDWLTTMLAFDMVVVTGIYAKLTYQLARATTAQANATRAQTDLQTALAKRAHTPWVVVLFNEGRVLKNIGQGPAMNCVWAFGLAELSIGDVTHLGSLEAGSAGSLPDLVEKALLQDTRNPNTARRHYAAAQSLDTESWIVTSHCVHFGGRFENRQEPQITLSPEAVTRIMGTTAEQFRQGLERIGFEESE